MTSTSQLFRLKDPLFDPPVTGHAGTANMRAGGVFPSERMMKFVFANQGVRRFTKIVGFIALALASFGGSRMAGARSANAERGIIEARGTVAKVVAVGPIALHAYSQFAGGSLYTAPAVTGTDRDCQRRAIAMQLQPDRVATFAVRAGQVACFKTTTKGSVELLWHAVSEPVPAVVVAKVGR